MGRADRAVLAEVEQAERDLDHVCAWDHRSRPREIREAVRRARAQLGEPGEAEAPNSEG